MYHFCTLFDSNYIDKGIALYKSLENTTSDFMLYIFAFDDNCYNVLKDLKLKKVTIISMHEFETEEMLCLKAERSRAEYCWTCTPISIEYVINNFAVDVCTYIDSDLYFFKSPKILFDEFEKTGCSVMITEHRFPDTPKGRAASAKQGKYCVQFNTFKNDQRGMQVLQWWKKKCIEWCYFRHEDDRMGDQKYLDNWTRDFEGVHELQYLGGGVAPWNINQYVLSRVDSDDIKLFEKTNSNEFDLVFYHFQNIKYLPFKLVNISAGKVSKKLKYTIYVPYLKIIEQIREMLEMNYNITFRVNRSCSNNRLIAFIQTYIMPFKLMSVTDIVQLNRLYKRRDH